MNSKSIEVYIWLKINVLYAKQLQTQKKVKCKTNSSISNIVKNFQNLRKNIVYIL